MKRILVAAIAAASLAATAAPADAQITDAIKQPNVCLTPVTKCVDEAADRAVALVLNYYHYAGETLKNGPDLGAVCELIWENGCGTAVDGILY